MKRKKEQMDRLPVWAKSHIGQLGRELDAAMQRIAEINGEKDTNVFIVNFRQGVPDQPLPRGSHIQFLLGNDDSICAGKVNVALNEEGELYIGTTDKLVVHPGASNVIYVTVE
jgi:hypothetical protein